MSHTAAVPVALLLALALAGSAGAAPAAVPATAALSSSKAGATHVALTVVLTTELQCGRLMGSRTLVLMLPARGRVATIPAAAVTVAGRPVSGVSVSGRAVTISLPLPHGMLCTSIRTGIAKVVLSPAAGIANPASAGRYAIRVVHGGETFVAHLAIHA
jgi:hypothetical protein